jgi:Protein of unknown function (DUF3987)
MKDDAATKIHQNNNEENSSPPNAILFEQSRYLKKSNRDQRLIRSPRFEDFIVAKSHTDLIEDLKKSYVFREVYDPLIDESPKVQELTSIKIWKESELAERVSEILNICAASGMKFEDASVATDLTVRGLHTRCQELRQEIADLERQLQHIRLHARSEEVWTAPLPFKKDLLPVPEFDVTFLPEPMKRYAEDIAESLQCPIDYLAVGLFVSFSSIIGAGCAIRPLQQGDWTIIGNLWGGIIGPPSVKKTPALNAAMVPLAALEKDADKVYEEEKLKSGVDKIEIEVRRKAAKVKLEEAIRNENQREIEPVRAALLRLEKEENPIRWKRYKTNDCTSKN